MITVNPDLKIFKIRIRHINYAIMICIHRTQCFKPIFGMFARGQYRRRSKKLTTIVNYAIMV